jgi:predicted small metal-binding protein
MEQIVKSYCLDCEWTARDDQMADRTAAVVDHAVETGHDIDSVHITPDVNDPNAPQQNGERLSVSLDRGNNPFTDQSD